MRVKTSRFGDVTVEDSAVISFPDGVVGFPLSRSFVIFDGPEGTPFKWLQATDNPALAFVICDPFLLKKDYRPPLPEAELAPLGIEKPEDLVVCAILSIPADPWQMTANLLGPLIFNASRKIGRQVVLSGTDYPVKYPVFPAGRPAAAGATPTTGG